MHLANNNGFCVLYLTPPLTRLVCGLVCWVDVAVAVAFICVNFFLLYSFSGVVVGLVGGMLGSSDGR